MHTPAGLMCRGTAELTASIRGAGLTYGELVRRVAHEYRDSARRLVEAEGTGALAFSVGREMRQLSSHRIWLRGRTVPSAAERAAGKAPALVRFRSDSVAYSVLWDDEGVPNGLSFDTRPGDAGKRAAYAKASDRQGDRQYEVGTDDDTRRWEQGAPQGIDRANTRTVSAPWFDPDLPGRPTLIGGHADPSKFHIDAREAYTMDGDPVGRQELTVDGWTLGTHLITNPDFWVIHTAQGSGHVVYHSVCSPGGVTETGLRSNYNNGVYGDPGEWGPVRHNGTTLDASAAVLHRHGVDAPVHGANGETVATAHHPDGRPDGRPVRGSDSGFEWNPVPDRSSIVVIPDKDAAGNSVEGAFRTVHPPSATGADA
ncbi:hypothetical protein ACIBEK_11750 [Nocardia fusca]|uniref:hypothetical protein n=1 Tax=Nocardia fusca TaxID=941183 RepID=UPI0037918F28